MFHSSRSSVATVFMRDWGESGGGGGLGQLAPWLKCCSTVALVRSNTHCWLGEEGLHVFMKTRPSLGLLSMQLLLTG